jgi:hypothetical protein
VPGITFLSLFLKIALLKIYYRQPLIPGIASKACIKFFEGFTSPFSFSLKKGSNQCATVIQVKESAKNPIKLLTKLNYKTFSLMH